MRTTFIKKHKKKKIRNKTKNNWHGSKKINKTLSIKIKWNLFAARSSKCIPLLSVEGLKNQPTKGTDEIQFCPGLDLNSWRQCQQFGSIYETFMLVFVEPKASGRHFFSCDLSFDVARISDKRSM